MSLYKLNEDARGWTIASFLLTCGHPIGYTLLNRWFNSLDEKSFSKFFVLDANAQNKIYPLIKPLKKNIYTSIKDLKGYFYEYGMVDNTMAKISKYGLGQGLFGKTENDYGSGTKVFKEINGIPVLFDCDFSVPTIKRIGVVGKDNLLYWVKKWEPKMTKYLEKKL